MSSGFVSAGTDQEPVERDDEWRRVHQELEEERRRKADLGKQDGGKSLFEILEQNKMAKQEAFEEKMKLKNQFRSLDEDEIEFLDSIMESTRAQEANVKRETAEQLELFRRQREEAEKTLLEDTSADVAEVAEGEDWRIPARKKRREKNKELLIPGKKRKSVGENSTDVPRTEQSANKKYKKLPEESNTAEDPGFKPVDDKPKQLARQNAAKSPVKRTETGGSAQILPKQAVSPPLSSLGLAGYSSESE
ncbi:hypothetical protein P175DRAFT_0453034 [Aspergillus ochraceoroseus IBT 24754]|uniref:FAM192A/Fyv6 N-terminal domain-containing protein n=2 Tax=Aspergillus ochraceoroseus TaxID=138278 RepID=A0A2T5M1T2_9EURO|nr:uncharacterized protein P175DRAFT_0453034 [Aspergillus ochraceoroseus IBT 24754]KKK22720.1 hypothetical protein AOCH_003319 [Aspergillus ochraceoroseus]PTU22493.1 hypothetical protein P175DRAFT_0453034 [Aspergillus ochraceoroseus IBT 24754]